MTDSEGARWFKTQFQKRLEDGLRGTPFSVDLLTAIAMQETSYLWMVMAEKKLAVDEILERCVGDTLDSSGGRDAFPQNKAKLVAVKNGQRMFDIARAALLSVAPYNKPYAKEAKKPDKFCHGFGIFQYDLQFFVESPKDPDYFLQKRWSDFDLCLGKVFTELKTSLTALYGPDKSSLNDTEQVYVAIVYNMGMKHFSFSKGFKQGHKEEGKYYGENIAAYLRVSKGVSIAAEEVVPSLPGGAPRPRLTASKAPRSSSSSKPAKSLPSPGKSSPRDGAAAAAAIDPAATGIPPQSFCLAIRRLRQETRRGIGFARTVSQYQCYWKGAEIKGLSGQMVERGGPGSNKAKKLRIRAGTYRLSIQEGSHYETYGYVKDHLLPGLLLADTEPRTGVLIHPCHDSEHFYLSSTGCINPAKGLTDANSRVDLSDSRQQVIQIIDMLQEKFGDDFPKHGIIPEAVVLISGEPS